MLENIKLEDAKTIIEIITGICFLLGTIFVFFSFKYKHDKETRNLYIKNCERVIKGLGLMKTSINLSDAIGLFRESAIEAKLYFPKDLATFLDNLWNKACDLEDLYSISYSNLYSLEEKIKTTPKINELKLYFYYVKFPEIINLYRRFLVKEFTFYDKYLPTFKSWLLSFLKKTDAILAFDIIKNKGEIIESIYTIRRRYNTGRHILRGRRDCIRRNLL